MSDDDNMINQNRPPAPPAGHMNTNVLPNPPVPHSPSVPTRAARPQPVAREPKARVTHLLVSGAGWVPIDDGTLNATAEMIMNCDPNVSITFMSEKKEIRCRAVAILATKTRYD